MGRRLGHFDVSVRQVADILVRRGFLVHRRGVGTLVMTASYPVASPVPDSA